MIPGASTGARSPECPRCGYGQTGQIGAWVEASPVQWICSECGLSLPTRDLLISQGAPPWFMEQEAPSRWFLRRALRTFVTSLAPPRLWSRVSLAHAVVPRQLALYVVFLLLAAYLGIGVVTATESAFDPTEWWDRPQRCGAVIQLLLPFFPWDVEPVAGSIDRRLALSLDDAAPGRLRGWAFYSPYESGAPYVPLDVTRRHWRSWGSFGVILLLAELASIGAFIVLPIARRRARVRWGHIARAGVYGLSTMWPLFLALLGAVLVRRYQLARPVPQVLGWGLVMAQLAVLFWWWWVVSSRYLRMTRAPLVAASVTLVGALSAALVVVVGGMVLGLTVVSDSLTNHFSLWPPR